MWAPWSGEPAEVSEEQLEETRRVARREAAPFVFIAVVADLLLAVGSWWHDWRLYSANDWWIWIFLALPALLLAIVFSFGIGRLGVSSRHRRTIAVMLLGLLASRTSSPSFSCSGHSPAAAADDRAALLATAAVVLLVNIITFALVFWEVDCGGPVARATQIGASARLPVSPGRESRARTEGWVPALEDYFYIALTNSIAFSPTDAMPLTHRAKLVIGLESFIAAVTLLIVAAAGREHPPGLTLPRLTRISYAGHRGLPGRGAWMGLTSNTPERSKKIRLTKTRMLLATVTALALMVGVGTAYRGGRERADPQGAGRRDHEPDGVRRGGRLEPGRGHGEARRRDQGRRDGQIGSRACGRGPHRGRGNGAEGALEGGTIPAMQLATAATVRRSSIRRRRR